MKFENRHIGPSAKDQSEMLSVLGFDSVESFIDRVVPADIRIPAKVREKTTKAALSEADTLELLRRIASRNRVWRSYIGMGFYGTICPPVIQRNILENPCWYTQYTPYQAEIAQGRLEALFNFQTMVASLTGLPFSNASLLDESTAAAEAMNLFFAAANHERKTFFVSTTCHPQNIAVIKTRAKWLGINVVEGDCDSFQFNSDVFGAVVQYPASDGIVKDYSSFISRAHEAGALVAVATDLLALTLIKSPGELGFDVAFGSSQRFGVPMHFGGPHAAFFAVKDELKRLIPGRIVGLSKDSSGNPALRLALQTREQHIRREKATSNICTSQVLLAVMASMYAVWHGPAGLKEIASSINNKACRLREALRVKGLPVMEGPIFDTVRINMTPEKGLLSRLQERKINLAIRNGHATISLDETVTERDLKVLAEAFEVTDSLGSGTGSCLPPEFERKSDFLKEPVFGSVKSETEMLRYITRLQSRDLSLAVSMIPLGSCTMKLNATSEMVPVSWPELSSIHPYAPDDQVKGYKTLIGDLELRLKDITGFAAVSFQPNSGAAGEYAGLSVIRSYQEFSNHSLRDICLIPVSAHGTNPASAAMAGLQVVPVACDEGGNIKLEDLRSKVNEYGTRISCAMFTYPSTHGVFEKTIKEACAIVHKCGAQVYMDGANLNALVGLCRPNEIGADVCHINLHKTFCIPHGGGGPGAGPIAVKKHLVPFLPGHPVTGAAKGHFGPTVSSAAFGSAAILPIPWVYIHAMGSDGLRRATETAILNANYMVKRLEAHYPVLFRDGTGFVAHECILDLRQLERTSGIKVEDVAKRLIDYGFHAPTVSWPVPGTIMVEPTESESKAEIDRFCDAMISIRNEIKAIEEGRMDRENNPLRNAPHTAQQVSGSEWNRPYSREVAAYPAPWLRDFKFWPACGRVDNVYGDRNLVCVGC